MMCAMTGVQTTVVDQTESEQGSSTTKVLADYAAMSNATTPTDHSDAPALQPSAAKAERVERPREIGGREGPEPTRFGDWEKAGRCIDF